MKTDLLKKLMKEHVEELDEINKKNNSKEGSIQIRGRAILGKHMSPEPLILEKYVADQKVKMRKP